MLTPDSGFCDSREVWLLSRKLLVSNQENCSRVAHYDLTPILGSLANKHCNVQVSRVWATLAWRAINLSQIFILSIPKIYINYYI